MFITAKSYFVDYKLSESYTNQTSEYATNFLPYIGFASQIPNVLFNWLNIFVNLGWVWLILIMLSALNIIWSHSGDLTKRVVWSLIIEIILFLVTVILAMVDSAAWPGEFFWITIGTVIVLNSEFETNVW
jgi:equilibrative nucleoside transporter 1/2/3